MKAKRNQSQQEKRAELVETKRNCVRRPRETKIAKQAAQSKSSSAHKASAMNIDACSLKKIEQDKHKWHENGKDKVRNEWLGIKDTQNRANLQRTS